MIFIIHKKRCVIIYMPEPYGDGKNFKKGGYNMTPYECIALITLLIALLKVLKDFK